MNEGYIKPSTLSAAAHETDDAPTPSKVLPFPSRTPKERVQ